MHFRGIADAEQLKILRGVLCEHCRDRGLLIESDEGKDAARILMALFELGWRKPDDLKAMLSAEVGSGIRPF